MAATEPRQLKKIANDTGRAVWKRPLCQQRWSRTQCRPSRDAHGRGSDRKWHVKTAPTCARSNRDPGASPRRVGERGTSSGAAPFLTTPTERLAALRTAFQAMLKDPDFLAACEKRNLMVDGAAGEEIDEIVRETLRLPQDVAEKIGQMMQ